MRFVWYPTGVRKLAEAISARFLANSEVRHLTAVVTVRSRLVTSLAVPGPAGRVVLSIAVVQECRQLPVGHERDVAATSSVAARGAAAGHPALASKRDGTRAAGAAFHANPREVYEHQVPRPRSDRTGSRSRTRLQSERAPVRQSSSSVSASPASMASSTAAGSQPACSAPLRCE